MKKSLLVLLALLLSLLAIFVACGPDNGGGDDEDEGTYTVSFILGYGTNDIIETKEIAIGRKIGKLPPEPERDGYTFGGWFLSTDLEFKNEVTSSSKFEEDVILVPNWVPIPPCDHSVGYENAAVTPQTCESPSILIQRCLNCGETKETELQPALGHKIKTNDPVPANCGYDGYTLKECTRKGCKWEEKVDIVPATGIHTYGNLWFLVRKQTNYSYGQERRPCTVCAKYEYKYLEPYKLEEFETLPIKQVVVGGQVYVDVASTATASATSLYRLTTAANVVDGAPATHWRADTLADSDKYTGDVLNLKLATAFDVAVIEFTIPNYWAWKLGPKCTVKYDIEVCENGEWKKVGTVSDTDAQDSISKNAVVALELDRVYNITEIRATVTHATRYTPAMICEIKVYGKVEEFKRAPQSMASLASGFITGSYNAWVNSSAENLLDNDPESSWCTDARVWKDSVYYGRSTNIITNWSVDYDDKSTANVFEKKTISKVVVNAGMLAGQTIGVVVCQPSADMMNKTQPKVDENGDPVYKTNENGEFLDKDGNVTTDENARIQETEVVMTEKLDENGQIVYKTNSNGDFLDKDGNVTTDETQKVAEMVPVTVQRTDDKGNLLWIYNWTSLVLAGGAKDEKGNPLTIAKMVEGGATTFEFVAPAETSLNNVIMVRVEVDNYGPDDDRDATTVSSVAITEDSTSHTYGDLDWTLRRKVYAQLDFPQEQYLAYLDIVSNKDAGREISIQYWVDDPSYAKGGYWIQYGDRHVIKEEDSNSPRVIITRDFGFYVSKLRIETTVEPAVFGAYILDITPYTVAEVATELPSTGDCKHLFAKQDPVQYVLPTCTTAGYSIFKCFTCDLTWKTDAVDATGHKWDQGTVGFDGLNEVKTYKCKTGGCKATKKVVTRLYDTTAQSYITAPTVTKYYHNANGAWSMTFDDGNYIDTYEWVAPQLAARNMKATAVITAQYASSYINEWKSYIATGAFDIGSHSYKHGSGFDGDPSDEIVLINEIDKAHFTFMNWFPGQRVLGFATPNGKTSNGCADFVNDLMLAGRSGGQAGTYCDPDTLTSRGTWGNLPSYVAYATTKFDGTSSADGVSYKGAIDYLASKKLWTVECIHTIYTGAENESDIAGDKFSTNKFVFEKKLDYFITKGVWVASYTEAASYFREAHAAEIKDMTIEGTAVSFEVTDGLDDTMLVQPLTFQFALPSGWTNVTVTQNGVEIPMVSSSDYKPNMAEDMACTIKDGVLYFDAIPDAGTVVITKK